MRILDRNKKRVYYCVRRVKSSSVLTDNGENESYDEDDYREVFSKPQEVRLSFLPLAVNGEILETGLEYSKRISVYTTREFAKKIHNGDRFFIFKQPPKKYDPLCTTADYYVHGEPSIYLTEATIYLRRMTGDDYGENY